jgi:uncharacterized membrane protein
VLPGLDLPSLLLAVVITLLEMTEVVALVFALGAEGGALRPAALGAIAGVATVAVAALAIGAGIERLPAGWLLWVATGLLAAFGVFLFRSTVRTFRRLRSPSPAPPATRPAVPFGGGFAVGTVESLEAVVVLLAIAAGGHAPSAIVGAVIGGALLVVVAWAVHERVRRVKPPTLKLAATSALFAFAAFWGSEAAGLQLPGPAALADLYLVPFFLIGLGIVAALVRWRTGVPFASNANR